MDHKLKVFAVLSLMSALLTLAACTGVPAASTTVKEGILATSAAETSAPCKACAQATRAVALVQATNNAVNQAAATAEIVRANAQATLNSANATLSGVQTQDQNAANAVAAQIAATSEIERADALATLSSAGSTQSAALIQDAIRQTQMVDAATSGAASILNQQNRDQLAAGTQTAVVDNIATQTQAAVATSQWYADQARQRAEQSRGSIGFLWVWCFPVFVVVLAGLALWGFWRWLKIRQANQRLLDGLIDLDQLQAPAPKVVSHEHDDSLPYLEGDDVDSRYELTKPDDQVHRWLDEVKRKLRSSDQKDEDNDKDN